MINLLRNKIFKIKFVRKEWLKKFLFLCIVTISNYWFWNILIDDPLVICLLIAVELGLFILSIQGKFQINLIFIITALFFIVVGYLILKNNFDNTLLINSPTETEILNERHGILASGLGILFTNKYSQQYYSRFSMGEEKYLRNVFYSLDPNLYFYRSHPREKAGIDEYDKYPPIILPIFIIGVLFLIVYYYKYLFLITYLILSVLATGLINPGYQNGPLLLFPFINIILYFGFTILWQKTKSLLKV